MILEAIYSNLNKIIYMKLIFVSHRYILMDLCKAIDFEKPVSYAIISFQLSDTAVKSAERVLNIMY